MPETPTFPILPVDRRYLERLDRSRAPRTRHIPQADDTTAADLRRTAAGHTLRRYFRRTFFDPRLVAPRPGPSLLDRCPKWGRPTVAMYVAVAVLPFVALALAILRTDLHPRLSRVRALTPTEVMKVLVVTRRLFGFAKLLTRKAVCRVMMA